jgi:hypothetical protein
MGRLLEILHDPHDRLPADICIHRRIHLGRDFHLPCAADGRTLGAAAIENARK